MEPENDKTQSLIPIIFIPQVDLHIIDYIISILKCTRNLQKLHKLILFSNHGQLLKLLANGEKECKIIFLYFKAV